MLHLRNLYNITVIGVLAVARLVLVLVQVFKYLQYFSLPHRLALSEFDNIELYHKQKEKKHS